MSLRELQSVRVVFLDTLYPFLFGLRVTVQWQAATLVCGEPNRGFQNGSPSVLVPKKLVPNCGEDSSEMLFASSPLAARLPLGAADS